MDLDRNLDVSRLSDSKTEIVVPTPIDWLCLRCKSMFSSIQSLQSLVSEEGYKHYSRREARQHADAGCSFCPKILWGFWTEEDDDDMPIHLKAAYNYTPIHSNLEDISSYPTGILKMNTLVSATEPDIDINICAPSDYSTSGFLDLHPLIYNMGSNLLANQALRLLDECQDSHDSCQRRCTPLLPNRVIDVGPSNSNPRLYVTTAEQRANYTTLSYCWGGARQLATTKATFNSRTLGIPMICLPRTIQDAIIITRNLNIRFLWVDAICIIQDDKIDQATEIRGMGAIYKQATLTIAAMSSENADQGFIKKSIAKRGSLFPFLLPSGTLGRIELVFPDWYPERPLEKLETRAWALQEFLLSPRLLLFDQREAFWQCQSPVRTPLLGTSNSYASSRSYRLPNDIFCNLAAGKKDPSNNLTEKTKNHIWSMIVSDYSRRHVQFEKDRFHAIAGIVNELKDVWQDTYLAGFWKKPLVHHLAWYRRKGELKSEPMELSSYDAPSWSWLSVNCPVVIYGGTMSPDAEVIDCTVEPKDATLPEGPLRSGTLTIEGAFLMASEIPDGIEIRELHEIMIGFQSEEYIEWENKMESEHNFYIGLDRGADKASQEVLYLRLGSLNTHHGGYDADSYIGLILEETIDEGFQPCFKRIGRWEHFMKEEDIMAKWADAQRKTFRIL